MKMCADGSVHMHIVCVCVGNKGKGPECKQSMSFRGDAHSLQRRRQAKSDKLFMGSNAGATIRPAAIISWLMVACHLTE